MGIVDLYQAYGIETAPEGHKHYRRTWVNIPCPHCVGSGYSLGFNPTGGYYFCYKCGGQQIESTLMKLLKIPYEQAKDLVKSYRLKKSSFITEKSDSLVKIGVKPFEYPSGVTALLPPHRNYLKKRGYNPDNIQALWGVEGTSPTSVLDDIPYNHRILIPIMWNDQVSTFQCRDYSGKQEQKYMACPQEREKIHHKDILYGHPTLWEKSKAIVVEGALDVWRLGINSCATLGTGYTPQQLRVLAQHFKELVIMFDPEPLAQKTAKKLKEELCFRGVKCTIYDGLSTDPGDMTDEEAKYTLKELGF